MEEDNRLIPFKEAAKMLGISHFVLADICQAEGTLVVQAKKNTPRYLPKAEIKKLQTHHRVCGKAKCVCCGKELVVEKGKKFSATCSSSHCIRFWRRQRIEDALNNEKKMLSCLRGWQKRLWSALRGNSYYKNGEWVKLARAREISGLTDDVIYRLARLGVISQKPMISLRTGKRERRPKRYSLYSVREMELARELKKT